MTNIEILAGSSKIKTVEDILKNLDLITDLLKEDVVRIIKKTGGFTDDTFEGKYAEAIKWTKKQLNKHHLKLYQRIFKCDDIKAALRLLLVRITNNTRNQFDTKRKNTVSYWSLRKTQNLHEKIIEKMQAEDPLEILLDKEMQILSKEAKIENLKEYKKELLKIAEIKKNENNNLQMVISF